MSLPVVFAPFIGDTGLIWWRGAGLVALCVLGAVCLCGQVRSQETPASDPTYEEACANWEPTLYACTVLSAKNSPSHFVTSFRGGVHTVYTSEVLGHCPLLPGTAPLTPHMAEGIQVLLATGETPNYRIAPDPALKQRLMDGYLPMMTTTWDDASGLRYTETDFVQLIGEGMEARTGRENSAAFVRLRVENPSASARTAHAWLCINGSNNGQSRGVSSYEYRAPLVPAGNRAETPDGRLRVMWSVPEGSNVEAHLRDRVPTILEWTETDQPRECPAAMEEKPFSRYAATAKDENHEPHKAFDRTFTTYWLPDAVPTPAKPARIGLAFPERRWLRQVTIRYDGGRYPALDGYAVEVLADGRWTAVRHTLNGSDPASMAGTPEDLDKVGPLWSLAFEPVRCDGVRVTFTKPLEGRDRPAVADFDYSYCLAENLADADAKWTDTGGGDYLGNYVRFTFAVPASGSRDLVVVVPFLPASAREAEWLAKRSFEEGLESAAAFWRAEVARGARFQVPEQVAQEVWNVNIPHMFTTASIEPGTGLALTKTNIGWYEAIWGNLTSAQIMALDLRGYHKEAEQYMEPFLKWQGQGTPPGGKQSAEGFLSSPDDYTWVRWTSNHGWLMWVMSDHYRLTRDGRWLKRALPAILAACDWVERERLTTKVDRPDGTRPPEWGLLSAGVTGDGAPPCYSFPTDAYTWAGLNAAAAVLRDIGHPRAAEMTAAAKEYRECIVRAAEWAVQNTPRHALASGGTVPLVPIDVYNTWKISDANRHPWWLDVGPLHLVDCGVLDAGSRLADWMITAAEDHWLKHGLALDEPWYAPHRAVYLGRDEVGKFLEVYYAELAEGVDRQTYVPVEGHKGVQNLPWADGESTRFLRMMMLREHGDSLELCPALPRAWLRDGQQVRVERAPTYFGEVSFTILSQASSGTITAVVTPPARTRVPIRLRIRHPDSRQIAAVTVNGRAHSEFSGEWIELGATGRTMEIVAQYR